MSISELPGCTSKPCDEVLRTTASEQEPDADVLGKRSVSLPDVAGSRGPNEDALHCDDSLKTSQSAPEVRSPVSRQPIRLPDNLITLARVVSRTLSRSQHFECKICYTSTDVKQRFVMEACGAKQLHAVCRSCATCYITGRVEEKKVDEFRCPLYGADSCTGTAQDDEIRALLTSDVYDKYMRFLLMSEDPHLRECPVCAELVTPMTEATNANVDLESGKAVVGTKIESSMRCSQGHDFCYYHANAHPPGAEECNIYTLRETREQKLALDSMGAKECPYCSVLTMKSEGCNHITCPGCHKHWCWTCGEKLDTKLKMGIHYSPANPIGCLQFVDIDKKQLTSCKMLLVRILALPGTILGLLAFWAGLPLYIACGAGFIVQALLLVLTTCAWCPLGCCFAMLLKPLGTSEQQTELLMCAPWSSCWASCECIFGPFGP